MLNDEFVVKDFGMKIALNSIDPNKLKGMDKLTVDQNMILQKLQSAKSVNVSDFQIGRKNDVLRAISGETLSDSLSNKLYGNEAIHFYKEIEFKDLLNLSILLLEIYQSNAYQKVFPWFDNMKIVKFKPKIKNLDTKLIQNFAANKNIYLVAPEIIEELYIDQVSLTEHGKLIDFDISDVISYFKENTLQIDLATIKKRYIYARTETENEYMKKWPLYKCILTEITDDDGEFYTLMLGMWFKVDTNYRNEVQEFLSTLPEAEIDLPNSSRKEYESNYNDRVPQYNNSIITLDMKYGDEKEKIEFCDLMSLNRQFIHVKPWKSSSTLSHLFSQGTIAGTLLLEDGKFRRNIKEKIRSIDPNFDYIEENSLDPSTYEIIFAIIYKEDVTPVDRIPFFSKINLMHNAKILMRMRYKVSVKQIKID